MVYSRGTLCCGNGYRRRLGRRWRLRWVSNTLGPRWGFAAISFGYLQIAIGFIPMLYFVLGALSYILKWPALNEDPITKTIAALIILWALALTQFGGTKYTARIAKVGFFAGILLPAFILIALAAIYLHSGAPVAIEMDAKTFFPDFSKVGTTGCICCLHFELYGR